MGQPPFATRFDDARANTLFDYLQRAFQQYARMRLYIVPNNAMRPYESIVPYAHWTKHSGIRANLDTMTYRWVAFCTRVVGNTDGPEHHAAQHVAIVAEKSGLTDDRPPAVIENKSSADRASRMYFSARKHFSSTRKKVDACADGIIIRPDQGALPV
ncbi:MAG TPA: hypothetical protein VME63_06775 [Dyella sp.]|nr:hypothetical protein [Dyella sp.]HTV85089.1 hypothetical protein [Dyella sp.]